MSHPLLDRLTDPSFVANVYVSSNPRVIYRMLQRTGLVTSLKEALFSNIISEDDLRKFSSDLMADFEPGKRLPDEIALGAICVAIEDRQTDFAEEFILSLARLERCELPMAIRIARESCQHRREVPRNETMIVQLSGASCRRVRQVILLSSDRVESENSQTPFRLEAV